MNPHHLLLLHTSTRCLSPWYLGARVRVLLASRVTVATWIVTSVSAPVLTASSASNRTTRGWYIKHSDAYVLPCVDSAGVSCATGEDKYVGLNLELVEAGAVLLTSLVVSLLTADLTLLPHGV